MADLAIYLLHAVVCGPKVHYEPQHRLLFLCHLVGHPHAECTVQHFFTIQHRTVIDRPDKPSVKQGPGYLGPLSINYPNLWVRSRALRRFHHHLLRVLQCLLQMWRQHFHYIHRPAMFYARQAWQHLGQGKRHRFLQHLTSVTYLQVVYGMPPIFLRRSRDSGPLTFINERFHLFPQCIQGLLLCRCGLATCAWPFAPRLITIKMVQGDHN